MNVINIRSWFNRLFHLLQCSHFKYFSSRWAHLIYCFIYCNAHICSVSRLGEHIQSKEKINWTKSSQVLSPSLIILHYLLHAYLISFLSFVAKKSCYTLHCVTKSDQLFAPGWKFGFSKIFVCRTRQAHSFLPVNSGIPPKTRSKSAKMHFCPPN